LSNPFIPPGRAGCITTRRGRDVGLPRGAGNGGAALDLLPARCIYEISPTNSAGDPNFLALPNGIPSHDTMERVFARLDPRVFQTCFRQWMAALSGVLNLEQIAIDGKTLRGSRRAAAPLGPLHLVSAWAIRNHLSLGQVAVDAQSNEVPAIPRLLELLELKGALVTIDAMGCQQELAAKIRARGGHYLLTVKDNQENLLDDIQAAFVRAHDVDYTGVAYDEYVTETTEHGRHEKRHYTVLYDPDGIRNQEAWRDWRVVGMC
jgi:predicted transposase YbfD/YdcC